MIEKRITHQLLQTGELILTPNERTALLLPEHSATITIDLEGEGFIAQWSSRSGKLSGEVLLERLQDYGQEGGLLRLRVVDQLYRLVLLPPGTAMQIDEPSVPRITRTRKQTAQKMASRRKTVDRQFHSDSEYDWGTTESGAVGFLTAARDLLDEQLGAAGFDTLELVKLRLQGEKLATLDNFVELLAVDVANVERMPHQEAVARHVLSRLRGRAILADEVGLGKTIEAGFAVKELTLRGLAKRVLILCPATLRAQWREEMSSKFDLTFDVAHSGPQVSDQEKLILSLDLGVRTLKTLTKKPWDIVIVDEAHRVAGAGARKRRELISTLTTACRYAFFLTATPIQNDLLELYRLIELLRPGTFRSVGEFRRQYMRGGDPRTPNDPAALRRLISSAMVRTTRAQAGVDRVVRRPIDVPVDLGPRERELYALSTELLRNVMRDPGDSMRRRSLALRLTASPFSMGTTALRMADKHPDARVRAALHQVGHLAMDIQRSAREDTALRITADWVREHGRVLIFTQHTDTVTGLLRRLGAEGLTARAFHGSMSTSERAATVAAFRSGEAPIMISTDAGAEGQNLQFCNCVLNYDLPWNPMRIEQRIGRVDRLTQPCDEVFVANLYARGTIDEQVYRLLAEKLRMFELLFGQVTTILGELDESKSATFESRVLEALFAEDDTRMGRLISQLGTELADARKRASTLIAADTGLSSWMAAAFEHRKELTKAGSNELAPEVAERARIRQRKVQGWVRNVFKALQVQTLHDTGDGEGAFMTVQFDEVTAEELGGRTVLHVAFDRLGMEHHPEAELCAVGSPVFDELLALLKVRGDMHATVPVIPDDPGPSPLRYSPGMTLIERRFVSPGTWSGRATFRTTIGETESIEYLVTADIHPNKRTRLPRRALQDGEPLPAVFGKPAQVISEFEHEAAQTLDALRRDMVEQVSEERYRELQRIKSAYNAQISEAAVEDQTRLRSALSSEEHRLSRMPEIRSRAKMLALTLEENDWLIEETWAGPRGSKATLTYEWGLQKPPKMKSAASLRTINILALCSGSHWIDESEGVECASCDNTLCKACDDDGVFADCIVCGLSCCGLCRKFTGGMCLGCGEPERAPELDEKYALGWRLNRGATLIVGERVAKLARPGQQPAGIMVPDADVDDPARIRLRSYAVHHGLPADSGLATRELSDRPSAPDSISLLLRSSARIGVELSIAEFRGSEVDDFDTADLPLASAVAAESESSAGLAVLLANLRSEVPPPAPPRVLLTRRRTQTDIYLEPDRLVERVAAAPDDGESHVIREHATAVRWLEESVENALLAEAETAGLRVSLERRNDAVLLVMQDSDNDSLAQWVALPDNSTVDDHFAWYGVLCSVGAPGGRIGRRAQEPQSIEESFPSPSECELVDRRIRPVSEIGSVEPGLDLVPVNRVLLQTLGTHIEATGLPQADAMPPEIARLFLKRTSRSFTTVISTGFEVHETWRGHGTAAHEYRTYDGIPVAPKLDDIKFRLNDFGVCRDGHFYACGTSALCASCATWSCRACDTAGHQASVTCPNCSAAVCPRCMSTDHKVEQANCALCQETACPDCGRDPKVRACPVCDRTMCARCRNGELCPACADFTCADAEQTPGLPQDLALAGAFVLVGSDSNATTVLINRGDTVEQATIRDGALERWVAYGSREIDDLYRLRLVASRDLHTQVIPVIEPLDAEVSFNAPHVVVHSQRFFYPSWSASEHGESKGARWLAKPSDDLPALILGQFKAATEVPRSGGPTPIQVQRALRDTPPVEPVDLKIRWNRVGRDVIVTQSGIVDRKFAPAGPTDTMMNWSEAPTKCAWAIEGWSPAPTIRGHASAGDVEVVIAGLASLLALGVRMEGNTRWYMIADSPQSVWATSLSRMIGVADADEVSSFIDPNEIRLSSVSNAIDIDRIIRPVGTIQTSNRQALAETSLDAFRAWIPAARVATPEFGSLPYRFANAVKIRWQTGRYRAALTIGAQLEESITVEGGRVWRHEAILAAGRTDARQTFSTTGRLSDAGVLDREGHFGPDGLWCIYCAERVCACCADGLVPCDCCAAAVCKRCGIVPFAGLFLCPACSSMRPPTRAEARQHGRVLSTKRMLIGADAHHVVAVEQSGQQWTKRAESNDEPIVLSTLVSDFLTTRLAQNDH